MIATEFVGTEYEEKISSIAQPFEPTEISSAHNVRLTLKEKKRASSANDVVLIQGTLVVSF